MTDTRGVALLDVVTSCGLCSVIAAMALPFVSGTLDRERTIIGAQYLASQMYRARVESLRQARTVGIRFELVGERLQLQLFADGNGNGLSQRDISRRLGIMDPSTASTLASLARDGLIVRRKHPTDRRQTLVYLSAAGRALRDRVIHCAQDVNILAAGGLDPEEVARCRRVLARMIENLQGGR